MDADKIIIHWIPCILLHISGITSRPTLRG